MVPNHARYHLRYTPESFLIIRAAGANVKQFFIRPLYSWSISFIASELNSSDAIFFADTERRKGVNMKFTVTYKVNGAQFSATCDSVAEAYECVKAIGHTYKKFASRQKID